MYAGWLKIRQDSRLAGQEKDQIEQSALPAIVGLSSGFCFLRDGKRIGLAGVPGQTGGCSGNHFVAEQLLVWGEGRRGRGVLSARFASHTLGDAIG